MKKILLLLSAVAVMFTSCVMEGPDEPVVNDIVLTPSSLEVPSEGGAYGVVVTSDYSWTASTECDWIYVETANGNPGKTSLYIYVAKNEDTISREGMVRVFSDDYNLSAELYVWQMAGEEDPYAAEWNLLTDSYGNPAKGKARIGDFFTGYFNVDPSVVVDVDIYEHKTTSGLYLVRDPWGATVAASFGYASIEEAVEDGLGYTPTDLIIDCTDPNKCYIPQQPIGIDVGYGPMIIWSDYDPEQYPNGIAGVLEEGVLTWEAKGIYIAMANYNEGKFVAGNANGMFLVALPGVEPFEFLPECDITAITEKVSDLYPELSEQYPDDTSFVYAIFGAEIASAKYYIGDKATFERYKLDGGLTSAQAIQQYGVEMDSAMLSAIQEKGYVDIAANLLPGTPYTVAVYAENIYGKSAVAEVNHTTTGVSSTSHPCEFDAMMVLPSEYNPALVETYPDQTTLIAMAMGKELKSVKYYFNTSSVVATWDGTPEELVATYGAEYPADVLAMINSENGYAGLLSSMLNADTEYTLIFTATNIYGESKTIVATKKTAAVTYDDYTGELVIGKYLMSCTVNAGTEDEVKFENLFEVVPNGTTNTDFVVKNFGANVNGLGDIMWLATYDATAKTLTLSGEELGYEEYGNQFGVPYAYVDQAQTQALAFFSFANEESQGNDPCVLTVDATTKQVCALQNQLFAAQVVELASGKGLATWGYYEGATTTIAPYTATRAAKASVKSAAPVKGAKSFAKVPFSSVKIDKQLLERKSSFRTLQSAPVALEAANVKAFKARTVANLSIERLINKMKTTPRSMQVKSNAVPACAKIAK
uniref:BACON domain-containing protein n=1 Tax=Alistipes sp. TaxID=1872444 RepID=UPI004055C2E8